MNSSGTLSRVRDGLALALALIGALAASALAAMYTVVLAGSKLYGYEAFLFGTVLLALFLAAAKVILPLPWHQRLLLGTLLLAATVSFAPRQTCAATQRPIVEC